MGLNSIREGNDMLPLLKEKMARRRDTYRSNGFHKEKKLILKLLNVVF